MILLVSGASQHVRRWPSPHLGWLVTPRSCTLDTVTSAGVVWAADNDAYSRFDEPAYRTMLERIASVDRSRLRFVTLPDVVGDAAATLRLFETWQPTVASMDLPVALVAQDGLTPALVPWQVLAALFIGGTTAWKLGLDAALLVREAKQRGKWVHVGRCNTLRRMRYVSALDVDSFDGSIFSKQPNKFTPWMLKHLPYRQHGFMEVLCSS